MSSEFSSLPLILAVDLDKPVVEIWKCWRETFLGAFPRRPPNLFICCDHLLSKLQLALTNMAGRSHPPTTMGTTTTTTGAAAEITRAIRPPAAEEVFIATTTDHSVTSCR